MPYSITAKYQYEPSKKEGVFLGYFPLFLLVWQSTFKSFLQVELAHKIYKYNNTSVWAIFQYQLQKINILQ